MDFTNLVVITACPNQSEADLVSRSLIAEKLAACVQSSVITSRYRWRGKIEVKQEVRLLIKTKVSCFDELVRHIRESLSYENPEILGLPVLIGSEDYLSWINDETI